MDNAVNIRVGNEDLVEVRLVGDIDLCEFRSLSTDQFDAVDGLIGRIVEVVSNDDLVSGLKQSKGSE